MTGIVGKQLVGSCSCMGRVIGQEYRVASVLCCNPQHEWALPNQRLPHRVGWPPSFDMSTESSRTALVTCLDSALTFAALVLTPFFCAYDECLSCAAATHGHKALSRIACVRLEVLVVCTTAL